MAERYYISDTHFDHKNIIKYCDRPFGSTAEMDEFLTEQWNEWVRPEDHITHLGDIVMWRNKTDEAKFIKLIKSLNGHKRLHLGNHDHFPMEVYLKAGFEKVYATWRTQEDILWSHIPVHPRSLGTAVANVHGHIHDQPNYPPHIWKGKDLKEHIVPYINISCERTDFRPLSLGEVKDRIKREIEGYETVSTS